MIKPMNSKMTTNSQLSTTGPKKNKTPTKQKTTKQTTKEEWSHRNGDHKESYQEIGEGMGEKVQKISSINVKYKADRGRIRIVQENRSQRTYMYAPWTWTKGGNAGRRECAGQRGIKERKNGTTMIA